jgi:hypothetical protein
MNPEKEVNVFDLVERGQDGRVDWADYQKKVEDFISSDPDAAEALLSFKHPVLLHEEDLLERLNESFAEKYGSERQSYLRLDKSGKHIIANDLQEEQ